MCVRVRDQTTVKVSKLKRHNSNQVLNTLIKRDVKRFCRLVLALGVLSCTVKLKCHQKMSRNCTDHSKESTSDSKFGVGCLTEIGDPDGDSLVEDVEDHDDDEADDGGCDGGGHLRRHVLLERLQLLQVLRSEFSREGEEHSQAVHDDGHHGCQDQQKLQKNQQKNMKMK